ncbi:trypsin-like peptidase domain-containing protein [[Clostridium] innocuum]|nr:trypsin-like peptidase domain-containing protein [Erysipelotrichaceae bacterium]MCR0381455.1 trypsin-like peptidase domain-containing protein [[Clostridium] innocuum]MCR0532802.1 trypsin-like peptidase domain-containing protein [[Clostridium] innocuum]MCR0536862.1 trypsin-like peptidase domain-containing protein [[Clostridium] innocuum]MDU1120121.1 trypsin-like peptidase domain-containing protein [Erysipelotrichaceae bacterium]
MKRLTAFLLVALIGWNIVLTILYLQSKEDSTAAGAAQQTNQRVESASVDITSDVTELVAKSENKVVTVTAKARGQSIDSGSGAVYKVDGKTVYIITNNHVVADGDEAVVTFANGKEQKVEIVGKDELTDLALLKTEVDFKAEAFVMGNSSLVKKGEYVIAMGSPLGIEYQGSVSGGLISGVDRRMEMDIDNNGVADWDVNVLQTDAAINPGNSGGPLINMAGELIGINSMKITDTSVEGFGFALPINEVLPIITELENNGKVVRPILGISVQPIEQLSMLDKAYLGIDSKVESGLLIVKVASRTPAAAAGIKEGDILVKFDGKDIKDYKQFRQYLYSHKVKDKVSIVVNRNGKEIEKTVILE